jgi:hypothetical protein
VVLASVCGYTSRTGTFPLGVADLQEAVDRLAPAEAAVHWEHPNLWSWRELLDGADASSTFWRSSWLIRRTSRWTTATPLSGPG